MKKTTIIVLMLITSVGFTMDASVLKDAALKACETQLESVPEEMREKSKEMCVCNVNKTDYEAVLAAQESGDMTQVQEDAIKNAQECATAM